MGRKGKYENNYYALTAQNFCYDFELFHFEIRFLEELILATEKLLKILTVDITVENLCSCEIVHVRISLVVNPFN